MNTHIAADNDCAFFMTEKETKLKRIKSESTVKKSRKHIECYHIRPRNFRRSVLNKMKAHEESQKRFIKMGCSSAQSGPTASTSKENSPAPMQSTWDDEEDDCTDDGKCCVCNRINLLEISKSRN